MKYTYLIGILAVLLSACSQPEKTKISLVPYPAELEQLSGQFELQAETKLLVDDKGQFGNEVAHLQALFQEVGVTLAEDLGRNVVEIQQVDSFSNPEAYAIQVSEHKIALRAATPAGMFYAVESLRQLLPLAVEAQKGDQSYAIPALRLYDEPRFAWRGMHLDVSRHFFSIDYLKRFIDRLAFYKLNKLHLHLTDDQGWRIEIKKYPQLTEQGAWRTFNVQDSVCIEKSKEDPAYALDPAHIRVTDGVEQYGGFYTQDELRELVAYAQKQHVEIIPEIDMPGHMMAAINIFPELSTTGKSAWGKVFSTPLNPVSEDTYTFVQNVLSEVIDIFPSKYIHIGADEVEKSSWEESQACRVFMLKHGLRDYEHLQGYFVGRVADFLQEKGKEVIVWDDAVEGGIDSSLHVMYWRNWVGGVPEKVVANGNDLIMTPGDPMYFSRPDSRMYNVYHLKLHGPRFPTDKVGQIKGLQACLWTETVPSEAIADRLIFPRLLALSERAWTIDNALNWDSFKSRVQDQLPKLDQLEVQYDYEPSSELLVFMEVDTVKQQIGLSFDSEMSSPTIYYTTDGSEPSTSSNLYKGQFFVSGSALVKAAVFEDGNLVEPVVQKQVDYHKAIGKKVTYQTPWNTAYPAGDAGALTDGLRGGDSYNDGKWQGFTTDLDVTIDLGQKETISSVSANFMQITGPGVYLPGLVEVWVSADGSDFKKVSAIENEVPTDVTELVFNQFEASFEAENVRYVRFLAHNTQKAFLFTDEIVIN